MVAYSELGRNKEAHAEAAELERIDPHFSVGDVNVNLAVDQLWENDLRKAQIN